MGVESYPPWVWAATAAGTLVIALVARALAPWIGLVDDASDAPERKAHRAPIPLIGGIALLASVVGVVAVGAWLDWDPAFDIVRQYAAPIGFPDCGCGDIHDAYAETWFRIGELGTFPSVMPALLLALLVGLIDDWLPRGLPALAKLAGQIAAGAALAGSADLPEGWLETVRFVACMLAAVAAMNAMNTFDNSDGAAVSLTGFAFLIAGSLLAPIVLALLPLALIRRNGAPLAWLGDSGSHVLGILLVAHPLAWPALALPALDLARCAIARVQAGVPPWRGDRRHLAHRLEACGRSRFAVCAWLAAIGLPPVAGWIALSRGGPAWAAWAGLGACCALYAAALRLHPRDACPAPRGGR